MCFRMNFNYNQQIEELKMFNFVEELTEISIIGDEWNSYYEQEDYDDNSWHKLGGVNAEEN